MKVWLKIVNHRFARIAGVAVITSQLFVTCKSSTDKLFMLSEHNIPECSEENWNIMCAEVSLVFVMATYQTYLIPDAATVARGVAHTRQFLRRHRWIHRWICLEPPAFDHSCPSRKLPTSHPSEGRWVFLSAEKFLISSKISKLLFCRKAYPVAADQKEVLFNMNTGM